MLDDDEDECVMTRALLSSIPSARFELDWVANYEVALSTMERKQYRWRWKGDTSSDELSAHIFGYYFYYQLAAEDPERARVREQVRKLVDHLIENEFTFRDLDGKHTRWGVWTPDRLIQDPNWLLEAGINANVRRLRLANGGSRS